MLRSRLLSNEDENPSSWSNRLSQGLKSFTGWFGSINWGRPFRSFAAWVKGTRLGAYLFSSIASVVNTPATVAADAKPQTTARDSKHEEEHNTSAGQPYAAADDQAQQLSMSSSSTTLAMSSSLRSSAATESKEEKNANGREEKHTKPPISSLNKDTSSIIASHLNPKELAAVLQTNKHSQAIFKPSMDALALRTLFQAIVDGDYQKVEKIITSRPELLLKELGQQTITSLSGQKSNNVTPYRTALAVEDTQMAALIKSKMIEQKAGHIADQQYHEQFPAEWEAAEEKRWAPVFAQLTTLTHAIRDAKAGDVISSGEPHYRSAVRENSAVAIALAEFRKQLNDRLNETVTTGRHCNLNLLLEAYRIYKQHYADFFGNDWRDPRALLFWQQVIGTIQRGLPVNVVQAFCGGLYNTAEKLRENRRQNRSLSIEVYNTYRGAWRRVGFYPLGASAGLGFEWACLVNGQAGTFSGEGRGWLIAHGWPWGREAFRSLCQSKTAGMQRLMRQQNVREPQTSCVVM